MNKYWKPDYLPWAVFIAGGIGILLRLWLLAAGFDEKGLLISGHPADTLLWLLTAAAATGIIAASLPMVQANKYTFNFPPSLAGAIGEWLLALGILVACIRWLPSFSDPLTAATVLVGFLSVPALILCGLCRRNGMRPNFLLHGLTSIFWVLRLVAQYRAWSPEPQLQNYIFQLLATVFMMLSSYQRTAFDANLGNRRKHIITHLAAAFFCCLAVIGSKDWLLYGAGSLWAVANLCRLLPMPGWKLQFQKKDEKNDSA